MVAYAVCLRGSTREWERLGVTLPRSAAYKTERIPKGAKEYRLADLPVMTSEFCERTSNQRFSSKKAGKAIYGVDEKLVLSR